jgi:hypothetical protein
MAKPTIMTNRIIDTAVMIGTGLVMFLHAQFLILPPHFV